MIVEEIASPRLRGGQRVKWGELRPGDKLACPLDGVVEVVLHQQAGDRGRHLVCAREHEHVRPASDVAPYVGPPKYGVKR